MVSRSLCQGQRFLNSIFSLLWKNDVNVQDHVVKVKGHKRQGQRSNCKKMPILLFFQVKRSQGQGHGLKVKNPKILILNFLLKTDIKGQGHG